MRIVLAGSQGRLGSALAVELQAAGHEVACLSHSNLDITKASQVCDVLQRLAPEAIVNCSAYNAVDAAESNENLAFAVNATGPAVLARAAAALGARLVHYSSDFVFDGMASDAYTEEALPRPLSVYGASKLAGEQAVQTLPQHYIVRVASLFGGSDSGPRATVDYIAATLSSGLPVRAIVDRTVTPSYVADVVRATRAMLEEDVPFGIYHCVASGTTNWYELAQEIAEAACRRCRDPAREGGGVSDRRPPPSVLRPVEPQAAFCRHRDAALDASACPPPSHQAWRQDTLRLLRRRRSPGSGRQSGADRAGQRLSRSDSCGEATGQGMFSSGSFHSAPHSNAGAYSSVVL